MHAWKELLKSKTNLGTPNIRSFKKSLLTEPPPIFCNKYIHSKHCSTQNIAHSKENSSQYCLAAHYPISCSYCYGPIRPSVISSYKQGIQRSTTSTTYTDRNRQLRHVHNRQRLQGIAAADDSVSHYNRIITDRRHSDYFPPQTSITLMDINYRGVIVGLKCQV